MTFREHKKISFHFVTIGPANFLEIGQENNLE